MTNKGIKKIPLKRTMVTSTPKPHQLATYCVLESGFGYIDTVYLKQNEVTKALDAIKNTPALILDIRGYPKGTIYQLAPCFIEKKATVAVTHTPYLVPSMLFSELESAVVQVKV